MLKISRNPVIWCLFLLALCVAVLTALIRKQPWEYILLFSGGLSLGAMFPDRWKMFASATFAAWFAISVLDPLLKPWLDDALGIVTVSGWWSLVINGLLAITFFVGFLLGARIVRHIKTEA